MQTIKYVYWREGDAWFGYLQDYPDYWTQGETQADLLDHLADLYQDLSGGHIPGAHSLRGSVLRYDQPTEPVARPIGASNECTSTLA